MSAVKRDYITDKENQDKPSYLAYMEAQATGQLSARAKRYYGPSGTRETQTFNKAQPRALPSTGTLRPGTTTVVFASSASAKAVTRQTFRETNTPPHAQAGSYVPKDSVIRVKVDAGGYKVVLKAPKPNAWSDSPLPVPVPWR